MNKGGNLWEFSHNVQFIWKVYQIKINKSIIIIIIIITIIIRLSPGSGKNTS